MIPYCCLNNTGEVNISGNINGGADDDTLVFGQQILLADIVLSLDSDVINIEKL